MQRASKNKDEVPVSEMEIVNTFTKLIFGDDTYSARESSIVEAFRIVDVNVLRDDLPQMGGYLRNLGVREMIQLVARVHRHMAKALELLTVAEVSKRSSSKKMENQSHRPR